MAVKKCKLATFRKGKMVQNADLRPQNDVKTNAE